MDELIKLIGKSDTQLFSNILNGYKNKYISEDTVMDCMAKLMKIRDNNLKYKS